MAGTIGRARAALSSLDFRYLLSARLTSQFADGVFQAYLIDKLVFLSPENQSTAAGVAKAFALLIIPYSLVGPLTGVVIDRWSRRRILIVTPLVRAAGAVLLIPVAGGEANAALYAITLVMVSLNRFYLTTAGAVMPSLVPEEDLLVGNSLASASGTVVTFAGLLAGTQLADAVGPTALLAAVGACWLAAAVGATGIRNALRATPPRASLLAHAGMALRDLIQGARRLAGTPTALGPVVSMSVDQLLFGVITVLSVVVFKEEFRAGVASYGRIIALGGVGVILGTVTVGWLEGRLEKARIMALAFALAGVACVVAAPRIVGLTILVVSFVLGLSYPWKKVPADTMVQESIPNRLLGRVFALYDMAFSLPRAAAAVLAVQLIPRASSGWILAGAGVAYLAWAPVTPRWVRRARWAEVRFYAGGQADEAPRAVVMGGEEEPVEVIRSVIEERGGVRTRRIRVRTGDGELMDLISGGEGSTRWRVEREVIPRR